MQLVSDSKPRVFSWTQQLIPGGQSFFMKLRRTSDRTPTSMLIEPPYELVGGEKRGQRWRHMK